LNYTSHSAETPETKDAEVEKELWRLDTITTIDKSIQFFKMMRRMTFQDQADTKTRLVAEITAFQEKFLKYATENNLIEDPYIIQLADDLFVCISGLAASYIGERYITARQASQIQQRAVTINDITPIQREIIDSMPIADDEVPAAVALSRMRGRVASFTPDNMASMMMPPLDDNIPSDYCTPVSRARSAYVGCVANDTTQAPLAAAPTSTPDDQEPMTPNAAVAAAAAAAAAAALADDNVLSETQERMLSDLTPSSRGIGSNLRIMTRDAMIGMRKSKVRGRVQYNCGDENDMINGGGYGAYDNDFTDSCGGDDTFSSHASPGCARIGRMLSAPAIPPNNLVARTTTSPF
jgi:PBP1b-binding outer membrane lipoprotein LpoB